MNRAGILGGLGAGALGLGLWFALGAGSTPIGTASELAGWPQGRADCPLAVYSGTGGAVITFYCDGGSSLVGDSPGVEWTTAYDCDFSTLAAQRVDGGNGQLQLCGIDAGAHLAYTGGTPARAISIVPDAGLKIDAAGAVNSSDAFVTDNMIPGVDLGALVNLIPNFDNTANVRLWVYITSYTNGQQCFAALDDGNGVGAKGDSPINGMGVGVIDTGLFTAWTQNGGGTSNASVADAGLVGALSTFYGIRNTASETAGGTYSAGFPSIQTLTATRRIGYAAANGAIANGSPPTAWHFGVWYQDFVGGPSSCTIGRIKLEYRN